MNAYADETGLEIPFLVGLYQDSLGNVPDAETALDYADYIDALGPEAPLFVSADPDQRLLSVTPYDGTGMPGKCLLSPELEILHCMTGHGFEELYDGVREQTGAR